MKNFSTRSAGLLLFALAGSLCLIGCVTHYDISTFDGKVFKSHTAPTLEDDEYRFEGDNGQMITIPYLKVRSINRS